MTRVTSSETNARYTLPFFPLPSSASLPKIEADSGVIRAVEGALLHDA